jgi:hypothetical protein
MQGSGKVKTSACAGKNGRKKQIGSIVVAKFVSEKGNKDLWSINLEV